MNNQVTVLGVRCWKDRYAYVIATGSRATFTVIHKIVPLAANDERGAQLAKFRQDIIDLCTHHSVSVCFYRQSENNARLLDSHRAEVEGVLQEACYSHEPSIRAFGKTLQQIKSVCGFEGKAADVLLALFAQSQFSKLAKSKFQEAAVLAYAALKP